MADRTLRLLLVGEDRSASKALKGVAGQAGATESKMQRFGRVAKAALLGTAVAAGAAAVKSVKMAADFQQSTTELVTGAGESAKALGMVRDGLLTMSTQVGVSAVELSKGLYNIESAGYHGAKGLNILKIASEGAKVGAADMATVSDAVTTALNAYRMPASDAAKVTNTLVETVKSGKTHMQDLAASLGQVLPSAAALGVPFQQITAAMATMTGQGTNAARAATGLRFLLGSLIKPTTSASEAMNAFGLGTEQVGRTLTKQGLPATLQLITDAIGKKFKPGSTLYLRAMSDIMGGVRGLSTALQLTGKNASTFDKNVTTIGKHVKEAGGNVEGWDEVQKDFNQRMNVAKASVDALGIRLGTLLLPAVSSAAAKMAELTGWVDRNRKVVLPLAGVIVGLAVGVWAVNAASKAWAATTKAATTVQWLFNAALDANPIGIVVVALAALAVGLVIAYKKSDTFRHIVQATFGWIKDHWPLLLGIMLGPFGIAIGEIIKHFGTIKSLVSGAIDFIRSHWKLIASILTGPIGAAVIFIVTHFDKIVSTISGMPSRIARAARGMFDGIKNAFRAAINWVIGGWNSLSFTLPKVNTHIPGVGTIGGWSLSTPDITPLARGGVVTRPTLAMVGEAGPEAVIPLHRMGGGGDTHITINVKSTDPRRAAIEIRDEFVRMGRRNGGVAAVLGIA